MVMTNSLHPIVRGDNRIKFHLRMEDWPRDIPLPEGATSVEMDGMPLWPYQVVYLEPNKTVETVNGWFIMPLSIEQVFAWYPAEMEKRGYQEEKRSHTLPTWAWLRYHHPENDVSVEISIRRNPHLNQTRVMIQRSVIQPWSHAMEENPTGTLRSGNGAKRRTAARTPKGEKRRVPRKARSRVTA